MHKIVGSQKDFCHIFARKFQNAPSLTGPEMCISCQETKPNTVGRTILEKSTRWVFLQLLPNSTLNSGQIKKGIIEIKASCFKDIASVRSVLFVLGGFFPS